jgi:hypothetical protein
MNKHPEDSSAEKLPETAPHTPAAAENVFEKALRAINERAMMPASRIVKTPSRIRPTMKVKGWFRCHPTVLIGPIYIFHPKEENGLTEDPIFIMPELAEELRMVNTSFENAIRVVVGYLVATKGGALCLFLAPVEDPTTGRHHPAIEQKIDAVEASRTKWMRLEWNKVDLQFDVYTAEGEIAEPKWPEDVSAATILTRAFGERNVIKSNDDPLLVKFRGEA